MKKGNDITDLFHDHLADAGMDVRNDFWAELEHDLARVERRRVPLARKWPARLAAAASVVLVLGMASAVFLHLQKPKDQSGAFRELSALTPLATDTELEPLCEKETEPVRTRLVGCPDSVVMTDKRNNPVQDAQNGRVTVRFSIQITQQQGGQTRHPGGFSRASQHKNLYAEGTVDSNEGSTPEVKGKTAAREKDWAVKAGIGTSLFTRSYPFPLAVGLAVERRLNKRLSLEAGLQYVRMADKQKLQVASVPLRLQVLMAETPKVDLYAMAGGAVGKCFVARRAGDGVKMPVHFSVAAGIGARYKLNERFALFAESSVSHCFDRSSGIETLYSEYPTNLDVNCGVRMMF